LTGKATGRTKIPWLFIFYSTFNSEAIRNQQRKKREMLERTRELKNDDGTILIDRDGIIPTGVNSAQTG
jgi:hypothetical protein